MDAGNYGLADNTCNVYIMKAIGSIRCLGGVTASVLDTGPKVPGSYSTEDYGFLKAITIRNTTSF